ncbi:MAG: aminotransferase class I/II-fold pyridoxal phosphate-dependent enzyme [Candidatus Omnitrophota bacterium]
MQNNDFDKEIDINDLSLANFMGIKDKDLFKKAKMFFQFSEGFKKRGYYTYRRPLASASSNRSLVRDPITGEEKEMIMMGSNNYLGLASHPKVIEATEKALRKYGLGSTGASLLNGTFDVHQELEARLAKLKGCKDAVLFGSGYAANLGTLTAILGDGDIVISDELNHASIIDGCRLSGANIEIFNHNNMKQLESILKNTNVGNKGKLIVVDGVFSMDGDMANLPKIVELAQKYNAYTMVDEAHATGVVGSQGKGSLEHYNVRGKIDLIVITLSKALGCFGGAVCCNDEKVAEFLRFFSRSNFFSTSFPPALAAGAIAAIDILEKEPERIKKLWSNINYMLENLKSMGYNTGNTQSAIIPVIIGDDQKLRDMSVDFQKANIYLGAIPYPAVPKGEARFRLTVMAIHTQEDLNQTLDVFKTVGKKFGVIK